ncbi:FAD-dependent oxidoreductase [Rhodococcus sp. G-MC3]|uniref:FAD-dependent oxidoreductase n=1 Tax=Rhodococcus sp. G-MC3 TaxID=3046209 RepID=UPI0024B9490C|nr:FAD-dependent oxidoreductase [Rhodococcus sp. G-MC3]MDJ0392041.1 FAD-dependent oxidoreductase [Rhodococcus sp. G-MC3]
MTFVILQSCCNDASCVDVCPVDCIHPTQDEPEFMRTEMLHIDPGACIDCGACVDECPVDAIKADHELDVDEGRYVDLNADYFEQHPTRTTDYTSQIPAWKGVDFSGRRVAVVGSGPAAFYAATELAAIRGIEIEMYERALTPYGLVRAGVAPDHPQTKAVTDLFRSVAGKKSVRVHLGVDIGTDLTHQDLMDHHDAVVYATGADGDRVLGIPGEDLPGSHAAAEFVAWYNGNPEFTDRTFDLSSHRAVVIGNGNVALDVARILTMPVEELAHTDIADHALQCLRHSNIEEVVVLGRRGSAQAKFTNPELIALSNSCDVDIVVRPEEAEPDPETLAAMTHRTTESDVATKVNLLRELSGRHRRETGSNAKKKQIVFRFCATPISLLGDESVTGIRFAHSELKRSDDGTIRAEQTEREETLDTGFVVRSVGYRGRPVSGVPFDSQRGVIPNLNGRVTDNSGTTVPGVYVTGWIKRGPTGVIGTNRHCATETVRNLLADLATGVVHPSPHGRDALDELLAQRAPSTLDFRDWTAIDKAEVSAGSESGRPRIKFVEREAMRAALSRNGDRY